MYKTTSDVKYAKRDARNIAFGIAIGKYWFKRFGPESKELIDVATRIATDNYNKRKAASDLYRWEEGRPDAENISSELDGLGISAFKKEDKKTLNKILAEYINLYVKIVEVDYDTMTMSYVTDELFVPDEETIEFENEWERK